MRLAIFESHWLGLQREGEDLKAAAIRHGN